MALTKQNISLPFSQNLDTSTDEKQLAIGNVTVIENGEFDNPGKLLKRNGYEPISLKDTTGTSITNSKRLSTFKNELNIFTKSNMYSRITSLDKWSDKGNIESVIPDSHTIARTNVAQSKLDVAHSGGLNIYVWEDATGVNLSLVDNTSKNFIINKQTLAASGTNPKIVIRDSQVYIIYVESSAIKYRKFSTYDYNNIEAAVTAVATISSNEHFDTVLVADRITIVYSESVGDDLSFIQIKSDDSLSSVITVSGEEPSVAVNLSVDSASRLICTYYDGSDAKIVIFNYILGTKILSETSLETIANVTNITSIESSTENYTILYEVSDTNSYDHYIKKQTVTIAGVTGTAAILLRSVGLASKLFEKDSNFYFAVIHDNTLQSTYFLSDISANIVSKISPNTGGNVISSGGLPQVASIDDDNYLFTSQVKGRLVEDNGTFFSLLGVNSTNLDFNPDAPFKNATLASNLHIAGGYLKMYDGSEVVEHGFHIYPEGLVAGATSTSGGQMSDGTYEYKAVYKWTDGQGIIHRSNPSVGLSVTLSGGGSTQKQAITIPTLRLTDKSNVVIELYRTEASGTLFYLVLEADNDTTVNSISMDNTLYTDAQLISQEILYTTGGELENIPAPASSIIESYKTRIFVTTPESRKISYSKLQYEGFPVEFNDTLEINIPDVGGNNVTFKSMDDKLIHFKDSAIYYLSGDGPNNIGEQDTFIELELISSEIGCSEARSVILTPLGIMFKSKKGMYILTHSLALQDIGNAIEEFNNLTITSAVMVPEKNQVRFTTSDGVCLVYNYNQNKWATFTNHKAISAVNLENDYYYLRTDDLLYKENDSYNDNGSFIKTKIESGWISFAGIQAFQRVYRLMILGQYKSAHKLRIRIAYNFKDAWIQEKIIDTSDFIDETLYGSSATYGADGYYGGDGTPYQIRIDLKKQKCQSIKISIEDLQSTIGEGMELSNILFRVGLKSSEFKINESQQYGTGE